MQSSKSEDKLKQKNKYSFVDKFKVISNMSKCKMYTNLLRSTT